MRLSFLVLIFSSSFGSFIERGLILVHIFLKLSASYQVFHLCFQLYALLNRMTPTLVEVVVFFRVFVSPSIVNRLGLLHIYFFSPIESKMSDLGLLRLLYSPYLLGGVLSLHNSLLLPYFLIWSNFFCFWNTFGFKGSLRLLILARTGTFLMKSSPYSNLSQSSSRIFSLGTSRLEGLFLNCTFKILAYWCQTHSLILCGSTNTTSSFNRAIV